MTLAYIHTLFQYNDTLQRRIWDSIMQLSDAQFVQDVPYSLGSLRNHMVHLINVDQRWLCRVMQLPLPETRLDPADFLTREMTFQQWAANQKFVMDSVASLTETDLERTAQFKVSIFPNENVKTVWQILLHVVNHGTDHRAQMLRILHDFGAPTFDQDLMIHLWEV